MKKSLYILCSSALAALGSHTPAVSAESAGQTTDQATTEKQIAATPEEPPFELKGGMKGFLRGEGAGNFSIEDLSHNPGHGEGRFLYRVMEFFRDATGSGRDIDYGYAMLQFDISGMKPRHAAKK